VAANLVGSGERYAYALHLLVFYLQHCMQLHIDIMCKWGPWLQRTVAALLRDIPADTDTALRERILLLRQLVTTANSFMGVRKVLSHAHGTLHSLHCQVCLVLDTAAQQLLLWALVSTCSKVFGSMYQAVVA
jgi:hypothetical protein